jgi:putative membrane protein
MIAVLVFLLFIRLLSTVWAVVRLYGFRLERTGDEVRTEYGLFTRMSATIPLRRIQTTSVAQVSQRHPDIANLCDQHIK